MPENAPVPLNRTERVLAAMITGIVGVSVIALAVLMISTGSGAELPDQLRATLLGVGYFGLPIAFVLIVVLLVTSTARRRRIARGGDR